MIFAPPLIPDDDTARKWAEKELSKTKYIDEESLIEKIVDWINRHLQLPQLGGGKLGISDLITLTLVILILIVLLYFLYKYFKTHNAHKAHNHSTGSPAFFDDTRNSTELFNAAEQALQDNNLELAIIEQFRGVIRLLDERQYILLKPGMTAIEAAHNASNTIGNQALLYENASNFNRLYYAKETANSTFLQHSTELMRITQELPLRKITQKAEYQAKLQAEKKS